MANGCDQLRSGPGACAACGDERVARQGRPERVGIVNDFQALEVAEPRNGRQLVLVAVLAQRGTARHHDDALAELDSRDDGAHARVRDDYGRVLAEDGDSAALARKFVPASDPSEAEDGIFDVRAGLEKKGYEVSTDLCEHFRVGMRSRPVIQRPDQAVKRQLCSYGCENHLVLPY